MPPPILILGMHRSGTSCLAGSLQQRGLFLGEVYESRPYNRKGNRENQRIMDLNDAVLAASGGAWDRPPASLRWNPAERMEREAIVSMLQRGGNGAPWGFKDPRTLLTFPFWHDALPDARLVGTFRHPARVARSLMARDPAMPMGKALDLWHAYNRRLLELHASGPFPLVDFDTTPLGYVGSVDALATALGLRGQGAREEEFFDSALRTDDMLDGRVTGRYLELHAKLREAARRGSV